MVFRLSCQINQIFSLKQAASVISSKTRVVKLYKKAFTRFFLAQRVNFLWLLDRLTLKVKERANKMAHFIADNDLHRHNGILSSLW